MPLSRGIFKIKTNDPREKDSPGESDLAALVPIRL